MTRKIIKAVMAETKETKSSLAKAKVIIIIPGYNVENLIKRVFEEIPKKYASNVILVDDGSRDNTAKVAKSLGINVFSHNHNLGYGGAQKTAYWEALKQKPDVVAMLHSDYQHDGSLLEEIIEPVLQGHFDIMFGSRTTSRESALSGGDAHCQISNKSFFFVINESCLGCKSFGAFVWI